MKMFQSKLRKVFVLPLLIGICAITLFSGIVSLKAKPRVTAGASATEYVNLAQGKTYTAPVPRAGYSASLTDGVASDEFDWGTTTTLWYSMPSGNQELVSYIMDDFGVTGEGWLGTITIDLAQTQLFSKVRIHVYNLDERNSCAGLFVSTSLDGQTWTKLGDPAVKTYAETGEGAYWTELETAESVPARYVKVQASYPAANCFLNEIEVLAKAEKQVQNLALGATVTSTTESDNENLAILTNGNTSAEERHVQHHASVSTHDFILNLSEEKSWSRIRIHGWITGGYTPPEWIEVAYSNDGTTWTEMENVSVSISSTSDYWWDKTFDTTTSRYVRVGIGRYGANTSIDEIEVYGVSGVNITESCGDVVVGEVEAVSDNNLAQGAAVYGLADTLPDSTALSTLTDGVTPDGETLGYWQYGHRATQDKEGAVWTEAGWEWTYYLTVDLGAKKSWSGVKVHGYVETGSGINAPNTISVAASNDTVTWTEIGELTLGDLDEKNCYWAGTEDVFRTTSSRFVRIGITFNGWTSIDEIEVYAATEATVTPIIPFTNNVADYATVTAAESSTPTMYNGWDKLTDGVTYEGLTYDNTMYGMSGMTDINWVTFAFDRTIRWNTVRVHYFAGEAGIKSPEALYVAYSDDNVTYTDWTQWNTAETTTAWAEHTEDAVQSQYVRIGVLQSNGGWAFIDEVEIYAEEGITFTPFTNNVAEYATVTADEGTGEYNGYDKLADGVICESGFTGGHTMYGTTSDDIKWVTFAFDKAICWNTVRVHYAAGGGGINPPKALYVAYSDDGETYTEWKTLNTFASTNAWAELTWKSVRSQYVRVGIERTSGWVMIDEVEIYAEKAYKTVLMGCTKLALGKTVTGAPDQLPGDDTPLSTLTDGNTPGNKQYGIWAKENSEGASWTDYNAWTYYLTVDLGETKSWNGVRVHGYVDDDLGGVCPAIYVEYSDDGSAWTKLGMLTNGDLDEKGCYWAEKAFDTTKSRYVRIAIVRNGWSSIDEIEVYGEHTTLKEVAEQAPTVHKAGVKAHYACEACGAAYLYNAAEEVYVAVTAEELAIERLTGFLGANITLNNNLDFNYYAFVGGTPGSVQVEFTMDGRVTVVDGVKSGAEYVFVFKKLGPQNVGKDITARLLVDGEEKEVKTYSAHEYLYAAFKQSDDVGKRLIADIFEYGAAAQAYLGDTDTPVNTLYSDVAAYKTAFVAPTVTDKNVGENATVDGFTFTAVNLKISSEVQMLFKFNAGTGYKLTVDDVDVTGKVETRADGSFVYYTDGVSVVDFDRVFTAKLYAGETLVQTVQYSVNSYVYSKHDSENAKLAAVVQRLYNYGLRAEAALPVDRNQERVDVAKGSEYTSSVTAASNAADNNNELTDGLTGGDVYVAYTAGQELTFVLDFGEQKQDLAAFELHAMQGAYTENATDFNGVFPSVVTVSVSSDNATWEKVGVAYATTKAQTTFRYQIELPYAVNARYVKFVAAATGTSSDYYLIDEICAFVYSDDAVEYNAYNEVEFPAVLGDVYAASKDSSNVNLISGKLAKIEAAGGAIVEVEYDSYGNLKNTPASSTLMTDGTTISTWDNLTGNTASIHKSGKYFKFHGYNSRTLTYDLGYVCDVASVTFRALRNDDESVIVPSAIQVYLSMDGTTWYRMDNDITYSSTTNKRVNSATLTVQKVARFVAFEFEVENWVGIDELEITGKKLSKASDAAYTRADSAGLRVRNDAEPMGYPSAMEFGAKDIYLAYHSYDAAKHGGYGPIYQSEMENVVAYHDADGNMVAPMFDGVLFLINGALPNSTFSGAGDAMELTATSLEWLKSSLLWGNDEELGKQNVNALNAAVQKMKDNGIVGSDYKVKVYFSLYYPTGVPSGQEFGTYTVGDESVSDISTAANKLKLLQLWVQDIEKNFSYTDNLEIGGYYWYMEYINAGDQTTVVQGIAEYLKTLSRKFVWIPYFSSKGVSAWKTNGFDFAALQPNYAFDLKVQDSRLDSAASIAKTYGTAIEIEMGSQALSDARYRARYYEYLARAKELGYSDTAHFYYFGNSVKTLFNDATGVGRELYDCTYQFISGNGELTKPAKNALINVDATKDSETEITVLSDSMVTATTEIVLREPPKYGIVTINADGTVTYHADADYTGVVTFTYVYSVAGVYSDVCTVTVNVA